MYLLKLEPHAEFPAPAVQGIEVEATHGEGRDLILAYTLTGDLNALLIPPPGPANRVDGLWRHTCFEAFVMAGEGPAYREFNFSPSGAWQAYDFQAYREGGAPSRLELSAPARRRQGGDLVLTATLPRAALPEGNPLRIGLSAVVEAADGRLSYWALRHPSGRPDFHYTGAFVFTLDLAP